MRRNNRKGLVWTLVFCLSSHARYILFLAPFSSSLTRHLGFSRPSLFNQKGRQRTSRLKRGCSSDSPKKREKKGRRSFVIVMSSPSSGTRKFCHSSSLRLSSGAMLLRRQKRKCPITQPRERIHSSIGLFVVRCF